MMQMTIPYLLDRAAVRHPGKTAVISEHGSWTFPQWRAESEAMALALKQLGVMPGDHVAVIFLNGRRLLALFVALFRLGAVAVPLNVRLSTPELAHIIADSDAGTVIFDARFTSQVEHLRQGRLPVGRWIISGGEDAGAEVSLDQALEGCRYASWEGPPPAENQTALILYTAGTTGKPKGVVLTHHNCVWAAASAAAEVDLRPDYRVALVFPLYHSAALAILVTNLYLGCCTVTMAKFDPDLVVETVQREAINRLVFPPTVWNFILQLPDLEKFDTSSVRSLGSGGEIMPVHTKMRLLEVFARAKLGETYGMTETMATISTLKPEDVLRKASSVGTPFYNVELRIVDEKGRELPSGRVGEIAVRGPNVASGYYKDPATTAKTFPDGWLRTGDLGEMDPEGFLFLRGRKKELIISGGENIYPREIEEVLIRHPAISEVAVVGVPDAVWGQRVHAVVALKEGHSIRDQEVVDFCRGRLAGFKKPKTVQFVKCLPRSAAGKVLKRKLLEEMQSRNS
ncbi:MAG: long-chain-fatty-acid--CoA ligase [Proteobacteria bacterium]|nr:long-chain-fatty-acid--CoA ligase [Pseudomonadota bacterium]MBU1451467.1 long-chain-fatty-acid--CoA ligase [Pseudomonadota bacterium]MBU2470498.1 long-chain-fatty-acid--CoA ligase [Pseudomonadota bacterium]